MDVAYLLKRRADVVARHALLESVPGSGYHPDDEQARGEQRKGRKPLSLRPVAIQYDGRSWLVGDDVKSVRESLGVWVDRFRTEQEDHKAAAAAAGIEPSAPPAQARHAERVCERVAGETTDVIELQNQEFNAVLYGLREVGVLVVTAGVLP